MLSLTQVVVRNPRLASRTWPDEAVVYSPDDNFIHSLNETASVIWEFLVHGPTVAQIIHHVEQEFEVGEEQATRDVLGFLKTLADRGLVVVSELSEEDDK